MSKIVELYPSGANLDDALAVVESLRRDLENGKIVAFSGVGIARDDSIYRYQAMAQAVSNLRIVGALDFAKARIRDE